MSSWPQSAKTYDLKKHVLSYLLHLTNTIIAVRKDTPIAVRKDIRPAETFTFRSPTLNKHNHCSQQRHTILLFDCLLSSWPQSAKTYDLKKHVLSDLLHLTNTIIAVRKDIQYSLSIFSCLRIKTHPLQSAKTYDLQKHLISDLLLHLTNTIIAVRKDIRPEETFTFRSPTLNKHNHCSQQRHTILLFDFLLSSWPQSAKTYDLKKHVLSDLLHLTNTIIAVRKDIQYSLSIFACLRGRNPHKDIRPFETFTFRSPTLTKHNHGSPQRHL